MMRDTVDSFRRYLRSIPFVHKGVRLVEDVLFPRHPQREHRVVPLAEGLPEVTRVNVRRHSPVETPLAAELPCVKEAAHLQRPTYTPPTTFGAVLPNVLFCPYNNVVLTEDRHVIEESVGPAHCRETLNRRPLSEGRIEPISGTATALRSHYRNHYETLIDNLPRLALLHESPFSDLDTIKVLYSGELTPIEDHLLPSLLPPNAILHRVAPKRRIYRVENYILSSFLTQCYGSYLPSSYLHEFRSAVLPTRPSRQNRRFFISRAYASTRHLLNREALLTALQPLGFESVVLEHLSPQEQIELFYDADAIVAPHGAGLANLCFATDVSVVELYPIPKVRPCYYFLSKALGHRYTYCLPSRSDGHTVFADFEVDVSQVLDRLEDVLSPRPLPDS